MNRNLPVKDVTKEALSENTWELSDEIMNVAERIYGNMASKYNQKNTVQEKYRTEKVYPYDNVNV